jgi:hypothetical protein
MTNYRPVSLLTVLSKLFEKANICMLKANWSQKSMVLGKGELSTENAAFRLRDSIFKSINQKKHVRGFFFCDLAKVLYGGNYKMLLANLHCCGTQGIFEE